MKVMNAAGLAVPNWPVEWGGKDWTPLQKHLWHEEMQLACVPPPLAFNASMIGPVIAHFGSQEMKERFLPATANLDIWWCQGFSEPNAGSDLASLTTRAERDGDGAPAEVVDISFYGHDATVRVRLDSGEELAARTPATSVPTPGDRVRVGVVGDVVAFSAGEPPPHR
jgi:hypothetical protein